MRPWLEGEFGNPSSIHEPGRQARMAIDEARETLADALGCSFGEVTFTSGATEAIALAMAGVAMAHTGPRRRILVAAAEHHAVLETHDLLGRLGFTLELVPVDDQAAIDLNALEDALAEDVLLVAVMHANNELGTINPVAEVLHLVRRHGALVLVDSVQTFLDLPLPEADLIVVSGHKVHGPKGTGALMTRAGTPINPLLAGGGQEREMRGGTENVAGIVGFGAAVRALRSDPGGLAQRRHARDAFAQAMASHPDWQPTLRDASPSLGGHLHGRFPGLTAESMLIVLDRLGIDAASGAACSSGSLEPSHVLLACGWDERSAGEGLRFTFGRQSTVAEAQRAADLVAQAADQIRARHRSASGTIDLGAP